MTTTIGIDIRMLARGNKTGIEEYTCQLLSRLLPLDASLRFKLFYSGWKKEVLEYPWLHLSQVELHELRVPNRLLDGSSRFLRFPPLDLLVGGVDKFFSPHIFLSATTPRTERIVTFHDLSFEKYPEFYSFQKNFWHFSMAPRRQAARARKIIAVSDSTRQDLVDIYGVDPERIRVIYSGLAPAARRTVGEKEEEEVRRRYRLPADYVLYLGTLEPRKNIISLLQAFAQLKERGALRGSGCKLVIAGSRGWLYKDIFRTAQDLLCRDDIIFSGFIEEKYKPALYRMARAFVYPSFYEGFGFPPLEAMAQGTPVITSAISSMPEAVGDAALLFNPSAPQELQQALEQVLTDPSLARSLAERGKERASAFDWNRCAEETLEFILS
jgi:glycosyltransferase involved in cell wall biosynthesis